MTILIAQSNLQYNLLRKPALAGRKLCDVELCEYF